MNKKTNPVWLISDEAFKQLVEKSKTYTEILSNFGLPHRGGNAKVVKRRISELGLVFHSILYNKLNSDHRKKPILSLLFKGSKVKTHHIKQRLISEGLIEEKCVACGVGPIWNGKKLSLHLHHKNEDHTDARFENLELLCPNCHSQTSNYCGKAHKKPPSRFCTQCDKPICKSGISGLCKECVRMQKEFACKKEELEELSKTLSCVMIGKKFGVSSNTIKKWMLRYGIKKVFGLGDFSKYRAKILPQKEELYSLLKEGVSIEKIALKYGVCYATITSWCRRYKIKPLSHSELSVLFWKRRKERLI
jgi:hypothetical protein